MAAADVEIVYLGLGRRGTDGKVFFGDSSNRTISENIKYTDVLVVMPDPTIAESLNYPTIKEYLKAMATRSDAHIPVVVTNTIIVTRKTGT